MPGKVFARINPWLWWEPKFRSLTVESKLVFVFLMIHPNLNMIGAMRTMIPTLATEMGVDLETFSAAFNSLAEATFVRYDPDALLLWLPDFLRQNKPANPNCVRAWPGLFTSLPDCELRFEIADEISAVLEELPDNFQVWSPNCSETVSKSFENSSRTVRKLLANSSETVPEGLSEQYRNGSETVSNKEEVAVAVSEKEKGAVAVEVAVPEKAEGKAASPKKKVKIPTSSKKTKTNGNPLPQQPNSANGKELDSVGTDFNYGYNSDGPIFGE